jgi:hypothetical protein
VLLISDAIKDSTGEVIGIVTTCEELKDSVTNPSAPPVPEMAV